MMQNISPVLGSILENETIKGYLFLAGLLILCLLKLVLVSGNEIVAEPDDALTYLRLSAHYWTGMDFPYRPAAYPTWIALVHITGVPLRIAAELLFLFSGIVFAYTLRKVGIWIVIACAAFAAIIFHPFSFSLLDRAMSDTFYAPVLILALSFAILTMNEAFGKRKKVALYSTLSGLCFAVLWNTREEHILILLVLTQILLSAALISYFRKMRGKELLSDIAVVFLPLFIVMVSANFSVNTVNYFKYSYWGQANTQPSWINGVLTALTRIRPSHPIRYAAITKEALSMAYPVSPTLARMKGYLEQQENQYVGVKGEIGTAGFIFYLRWAVAGITDGSLASIRKACADIEKEIYAAMDNGELPSRPVFINPRVDPAFSVWLPYLPGSILNICKLFVGQYKPATDDHSVVTPEHAAEFNKLANRRINLIMKGPIHGWVAIPGRRIERIDVHPTGEGARHSSSNNLVAFSHLCEFKQRPDIENRYNQNGTSMQVIGFTLPALPGRFALNQLSFVLHTSDGQEIAIMPLEKHKPIEFNIPGTDQTGYGCIEDFSLNISGFQRRLSAVQTGMAALYAKGSLGLSLLGILMALLAVFWVRKTLFFKIQWIMLLANLSLFSMAGIVFYGIIDASAWPIVEQPRYLFSMMLLYSAFIILLNGCTIQSVFFKLMEQEPQSRESTHG